MLGSDSIPRSVLEMIFADLPPGANLDNRGPEALLYSMTRYFKFLPRQQRHPNSYEKILPHGVMKPIQAEATFACDWIAEHLPAELYRASP